MSVNGSNWIIQCPVFWQTTVINFNFPMPKLSPIWTLNTGKMLTHQQLYRWRIKLNETASRQSVRTEILKPQRLIPFKADLFCARTCSSLSNCKASTSQTQILKLITPAQHVLHKCCHFIKPLCYWRYLTSDPCFLRLSIGFWTSKPFRCHTNVVFLLLVCWHWGANLDEHTSYAYLQFSSLAYTIRNSYHFTNTQKYPVFYHFILHMHVSY
jgi:hypothetical protein